MEANVSIGNAMNKSIYFVILAMFLALTGCNKNSEEVKSAADVAENKLQQQTFDVTGLELEEIDINGDGRADQRVYSQEGVVLYVVRDLNFDGKTDITEFYDVTGARSRDEIDLDYDGVCDLIVTYENDKPVKKEFSVDFEGNRHGVQLYDSNGNRTQINHDYDADGNVDVIEFYHPKESEPYKVEDLRMK